jgi:chromate reductase
MPAILGLSGTLRQGSYSAALLRACAAVAPAGVAVEIGSIRGVPLYDGDVEEATGFPPAVLELKRQVLAADALLFVTAEYNHSIPGTFKNAIDWVSRGGPEKVNVFKGKTVAVMGSSSGFGASRQAQTAWLPVFRALETNVWFGRQVYVANADKVFDATGGLIDDKVRGQITNFMKDYAAHLSR